MNTNLFYFKQLNVIGGIETFFYNLVRKYGKDYDITILYREADREQVRRLAKYVQLFEIEEVGVHWFSFVRRS